MKTFMAEGKVSSWFKDARVVKTTSAVMNFYTPLRAPVAGKIMIVGDAAPLSRFISRAQLCMDSRLQRQQPRS